MADTPPNIEVDPTPWGHALPAVSGSWVQPGIVPDPPPIPSPAPAGGYTKPVSYAAGLTGDALRAAVDWLQGPGLTTATRGLSGLVNTIRDPGNAIVSPFATMISPEAEKAYQARRASGEVPLINARGAAPLGAGTADPGTQLGNAVFAETGLPEYTAQSAPERILMSGIEGGIANAPLGWLGGAEVGASRALPAAVGALGGITGQTVREALPPGPNTDRIATAASLAPALFAGTGEAMAPSRARVPTTAELEAAGAAGFDATRASPVNFARDPLITGARTAAMEAYQRGHDPMLMPETDSLIQRRLLRNTASLDFTEAHQIRKALDVIIDKNRATPLSKGNPNEVAIASGIKRQLDSYLSSLGQDPAHITAGTPAEAATASQTFRDALGNYAAAARSNKISGALREEGTGGSIEGAAQNRADIANSGWNYDNAMRQQINRFMENPRNLRGYSPDEVAALNAAKQGSFARNSLRSLANIFGGGGGLGLGAMGLGGGGLGVGALGPWGALATPVLPVLGTSMKVGQNALARGSLNAADELVRQRSPMYNERLQNLPPRDIAVMQAVLPGLLAPPAQPQPTGPGLLNIGNYFGY